MIYDSLNDKQRNCNHSNWSGNHEICCICEITDSQYCQHYNETQPASNTPFRTWQLQKEKKK